MSDTNNRHVGESKISGVPSKKFNLTIKDGSVTTSKLQDKAVTFPKLNTDVLNYIENRLQEKAATLQNQIDSLEINGMAISNEFGDDPHIGVSQYVLTRAINDLWEKIGDITGEIVNGISMVVTPEYFISEDGCTVHITAVSRNLRGIFEHIAFYINGELLAEDSNINYFEYDTEITETSVISCVAKILGIEYTQQKTITHYNSFWLGAGTTYEDVMTVEHVIPITNGMRGAYDVTVENGNRFFIIVGDTLREGFIRADINSIEIPFTESTITVDGNTYKVFTSDNAYTAGVYNIDING